MAEERALFSDTLIHVTPDIARNNCLILHPPPKSEYSLLACDENHYKSHLTQKDIP